MANTAIVVEHIGKRYNRNASPTDWGDLRDVLRDGLALGFRKTGGFQLGRDEDPAGTFWALKDVSFTVPKGEVFGVIGRNGSGKSTLLRILSRITEPTTGKARVYGSCASLLEIGTGFHPDLTGRQNIFLNGALLGMNRRQVRRIFQAIVDFSGVGDFLDMPVNRYSSGMYVRLAFSIAAHVEPDVLVLDEVLAVGDAEFVKKSMAKMEEMIRGGRTVLLVSHDLKAIRRLCQQTLLLNEGRLVSLGETSQIVKDYLSMLPPLMTT